MSDSFNTATTLIEAGSLRPESLRFESEPWTPFYLAGEIKATIFGFGGHAAEESENLSPVTSV